MLAANSQRLALLSNFFNFLNIDSISTLSPVFFSEMLKLVCNLHAFLLFLAELGSESLILLVVEIDSLSYFLFGILLVALIALLLFL